MNWIADDLRKRGIAVWNIDYRGVDRPGGGYPGTFLDAAAAADALAANASRYNLDTSPLVATGHSAGGHLALWLAGRPRLPEDSPLRNGSPIKIDAVVRSEEHTSELQSLMRISYAVFCLKKKNTHTPHTC